MEVRASPLSKAAAVLIIVVGAFTLAAGLANGDAPSEIAGVAFIVLGVVLYQLLFRFARRVARELGEAEKASPAEPGPTGTSP